MVRQCHLNTCPVGIATQDLDLRAKFGGSADQVVVLFQHLAEEVRHHLSALGARSIEEVVGRANLLRPIDQSHPLAADLAGILVESTGRKAHEGYRAIPLSSLSLRLVADSRGAISEGSSVELHYPIRNVDRAIGSRLAGAIVAMHGDEGLPEGTIDVHLSGTAGQSLGAWLTNGVSLRLSGTANDYVGKGMGGGLISVTPLRRNGIPQAAGNAVLYGATGGKLFLAGKVGQRFAVRNSGAQVVVEGCSDHGCEYMTGGTAVVLGEVGRNFAAGMTGGEVFVWDPDHRFKGRLADTAPKVNRPDEITLVRVRALVEEHHRLTGSPLAESVLSGGMEDFWMVAPGSRRPGEKDLATVEVIPSRHR
jgi:glutamate synthase domain-containing protein 3